MGSECRLPFRVKGPVASSVRGGHGECRRPEPGIVLAVRLVALGTAVLDPIDSAARRHPWLASLASGLLVALLALLVVGPVSALCALVAIPPACRAMLWLV